MDVIRGVEQMHAAAAQARNSGNRIGLVPTMGALHEGHLSLVRMARAQTNWATVSIFVNPLQFGPNEDLARYPRPFERDRQLLEAEGVDVLFAPSVEDMYPPGAKTVVEVQEMSGRLCGASRPGHFRGVTTAVAKLFNIVQPNVAFFGQKDAAQAAIIRGMVRDLNFDVQVAIGPVIREADGLAMSSRNQYLNPEQRQAATVLYRALMRVQQMADRGERSSSALLQAARGVMAEEPLARLDYVEAANPETLESVADIDHGALIAIAAFVGSTRLIDNILLIAPMRASGPH
ncbi:MAG TPA: pantoate--beta-alanine ligase [Terriglobales bacterium]|nr:pantoate--beta-alanine ligase [Terriglobales bacterium]